MEVKKQTDADFRMMITADTAVTAMIQDYFKELADPDFNNLDRVPAILWKVANAAFKFFENTTIAESQKCGSAVP